MRLLKIAVVLAGLLAAVQPVLADEYEKVDSSSCVSCHEESAHKTKFPDELSRSIHKELACQDCHSDKDTVPHKKQAKNFFAGYEGCGNCHQDEMGQYKFHGVAKAGSLPDLPKCSSCHGSHDILPSSDPHSKTNPANMSATCGVCHENIDLVKKYDILVGTPVKMYGESIHGMATKGGIYLAATCIDCHSSDGSAHKILGPGDPQSSINHFNIPKTCGKCHKGVEKDYWEGIHGKRAAQGETDVPVCTTCHGEHGILSPSDPRSPVSKARVAEATCAPCHESATLNEKYGLPPGRLASFIDSYHGLKSKAGDIHVANCASCHGVHRILPSSDPASTVNAANLQKTCGECHPNITAKLAATPIHGLHGGLRTKWADIIAKVYLFAIVLIIGAMVLHWLLDLFRQILNLLRRPGQVIRMRPMEVAQHSAVMLTFVALIISGFALRFSQSWLSRFFFGWVGGFQLRGTIHRIAAVLFILTVIWHLVFLFTKRGRGFFLDMWPKMQDFKFFWDRILYNLGRKDNADCIQRFSYVEKAEYWAIVWGSVVMIVTGILLWFDNWFIRYLPKGALDVSLVIHYYEAWLATLAIAVWHLYSTVFNPHVYPMNPSWITGKVPEEIYLHEHPGHFDEARRETDEYLKREAELLHAAETEVASDEPGDSRPQS